MHLWCDIFPQATLTLNLLRTSRINPSVSVIAHLFGQFDSNRTPLAPPGTRAVAHVKPKARKTWDPHGEDAWYVRPKMDHYRCYRVWMTGTNKTIIVDTLEFFPQHVKMSHLSSSELAIQAARKLTFALRNPAPAAPFAHISHEQHEAMHRLAKKFKDIADPEPPQAGGQLPEESPSVTLSLAPDITNVPRALPPEEATSCSPNRVPITERGTQLHCATPPRVDTPSPRTRLAPPRVNLPPATPNSHRRLSPAIKTPKTLPVFDLYKKRRQTMRPSTKIASPIVPQRVVDYLGQTTRHLLDNIQADTGIYYRMRSAARLAGSNLVTRFGPDINTRVGTAYDTHIANEVTHAVTGETLNIRKILQDAETRPAWKVGNYNEYGRLFQGRRGGVKRTDPCFFIHHRAIPKGSIPTYVKFCLRIQTTQGRSASSSHDSGRWQG
jgi:hypothetical protein